MSDVTETIVHRTVELAEVPAPTGSEEERSAIVRSWWDLDGLAEVRVDGAGNVWGRARDGEGPIVILCAHLDTVFGADVPHTVRVDGDLLIGPSVGDDSVAVAALSAAGMALQDGPHPVWLLATVGEEGLGNLRGVIAALDGPAHDGLGDVAQDATATPSATSRSTSFRGNPSSSRTSNVCWPSEGAADGYGNRSVPSRTGGPTTR